MHTERCNCARMCPVNSALTFNTFSSPQRPLKETKNNYVKAQEPTASLTFAVRSRDYGCIKPQLLLDGVEEAH
jgi:hypothetical protein